MRASEILRDLADLIDSAEQRDVPDQLSTTNMAQVVPVSKHTPNTEEPQSAQDSEVFVPPLQAKIEILKKSVGLDNVYDKGGDELSQMKKMAGIAPAVTDEAASDEPLDC
jgi:hypothetical protein